jgi:hypothetical protein
VLEEVVATRQQHKIKLRKVVLYILRAIRADADRSTEALGPKANKRLHRHLGGRGVEEIRVMREHNIHSVKP